MKYFLPIVFLLIFSPLSQAKKFKTSYVSFDLLNNWNCYPEGTEWICANKLNRKKAAEAMIILTAKQKGPADALTQYINYLKTPRVGKTRAQKEFKSKVHHSKQRHINQHMWADGFHEGSEVPDYFTRYLVTTKGNLAVLVTYSAHKDHYRKYASDFASSINSLRVMASAGGVGKAGSMGMGMAQDYIQDMIESSDELDGVEGGEGGASDLISVLGSPEALAGGLAGLGGLGYYLLRRRKKKGSSGKSNSSSSKRGDRHRRRSLRKRSSSRSRRD